MLREVAHFFRHVPGILALKRGRSRVEFFEIISERFDRAGMYDKRRQLVGELEGRVLEIGCGTGRMFPHYPPGARVTAIEPNPEFEPRAAEVAARPPPRFPGSPAAGKSYPFRTTALTPPSSPWSCAACPRLRPCCPRSSEF